MADDRDLGLGEEFDERCAGGSAFEFDGLGSSFLDEAERVAEGVFGAAVVAAVGHVDDQQ